MADALPRFALQEGSSCNLCHVNPAGGGLRNDYGISVASHERSQNDNGILASSYTGMINRHLRVGGDLRFLNYNTVDGDQIKTALFPMQADISGQWKMGENLNLVLKQDLMRNQNEAWILWTHLPLNGYLKAGKDIPAFGLNLDDHSSFIRGGNINNQVLHYEGLVFSPYLIAPGMIEYGIQFNNVYISQSVANQFIHSSGMGGFNELLHDKAYTLRMEWRPSFNRLTGHLGGSLLQQGIIRFTGIFGGLAFEKFSWLGEVDLAEEYVLNGSALASFTEWNYNVLPGYNFQIKFDFFDENIETLGGAVRRLSLGLEFFPIPFLEIRYQVRFTDYSTRSDLREEYLIQIHTWF